MMSSNSERCIICQEHGKPQPIIDTTQELPPFPRHTLATHIFYWKRMDFLIVADVFLKYFLVRKLSNSTSAAICAELSMIVTKLGLPHIIRSDNGLWHPKIHSGQICTYCTFLCTVYIYNSLYENEFSFAILFMVSVPPPYPWILSISPAARPAIAVT